MSPETTSTTSKLCPTCGTRLSEDATRCLVCGAELGSAAKPAKPAKAVQGSRMPDITLSLPAAIGLLALFLTIGAVMVFLALRQKPEVIIPLTPTSTATLTLTPTLTPTPLPPTETATPIPTATPFTYKVASGDSCGLLAARFTTSVNSIILLNNLSADCLLIPGVDLLIPQPTPTATPPPTSTQGPDEATRQACQTADHTVAENETLSAIASAYGVTMASIKEENGLTSDVVRLGQTLVIPLCKRSSAGGPTLTPTSPPPYPAPSLLLPADGAPFTLSDETVTLQWASVGNLRENESYAVTVEDVTEGQGRKLVEYMTDTKFIIPSTFKPADKTPHIFRWWVITVRKTGMTKEGNPIWENAGNASVQRVFTWSGSPEAAATPTP